MKHFFLQTISTLNFFLSLHNINFFAACAIIQYIFLHYFHSLHLLFCTYLLFKTKQNIPNENIPKEIAQGGRKAFSLEMFGFFCGTGGHYVGCKVYICFKEEGGQGEGKL